MYVLAGGVGNTLTPLVLICQCKGRVIDDVEVPNGLSRGLTEEEHVGHALPLVLICQCKGRVIDDVEVRNGLSRRLIEEEHGNDALPRLY
jgi:hypothetical protein